MIGPAVLLVLALSPPADASCLQRPDCKKKVDDSFAASQDLSHSFVERMAYLTLASQLVRDGGPGALAYNEKFDAAVANFGDELGEALARDNPPPGFPDLGHLLVVREPPPPPPDPDSREKSDSPNAGNNESAGALEAAATSPGTLNQTQRPAAQDVDKATNMALSLGTLNQSLSSLAGGGSGSPAASQDMVKLAGQITPETMTALNSQASQRLAGAEQRLAQERSPDAARSYVQLGRGYIALGDHPAALRVLDQSLKLAPKNGAALDMRAALRADMGDKTGAAQDAKAALSVNPHDAVAQRIVGVLQGSPLGLPGLASKNPFAAQTGGQAPEGGAPVRATAAERERVDAKFAALAAGISPQEGPKDRAQALLQSAVSKLAVGDMQGALFDVSRALSLDARTVRAWVLRSHISNLPRNHNYEAAILDADKALALDPNSAAAFFEKGYAQLMLGRAADSVRTLSRGVALEPSNAMGHFFLAMALEKAGAKVDAAAEYRRAAELDATVKPIAAEALARLRATQAPAPAQPRGVPLGAAAAVVAGAGVALLLALRRRSPSPTAS